jgi:hypothetical protein
MINPDDIKLWPMTMDVRGDRSHTEYVDSLAKWIVNNVIGFKLSYDSFRMLIDYAEENHDRLNEG